MHMQHHYETKHFQGMPIKWPLSLPVLRGTWSLNRKLFSLAEKLKNTFRAAYTCLCVFSENCSIMLMAIRDVYTFPSNSVGLRSAGLAHGGKRQTVRGVMAPGCRQQSDTTGVTTGTDEDGIEPWSPALSQDRPGTETGARRGRIDLRVPGPCWCTVLALPFQPISTVLRFHRQQPREHILSHAHRHARSHTRTQPMLIP